MYVDDLLCSPDSIQDVITIYQEITLLFSDSGFVIMQWAAKSEMILHEIPDGDRYLVAKDIQPCLGESSSQRVMGLVCTPGMIRSRYILKVITIPETKLLR